MKSSTPLVVIAVVALLAAVGALSQLFGDERPSLPSDALKQKVDELWAATDRTNGNIGSITWQHRNTEITLTAYSPRKIVWDVSVLPQYRFNPPWDRQYDFAKNGDVYWNESGEIRFSRFRDPVKVPTNYRDAAEEAIRDALAAADKMSPWIVEKPAPTISQNAEVKAPSPAPAASEPVKPAPEPPPVEKPKEKLPVPPGVEQVKTFEASYGGAVETAANKWLAENPDIEIVDRRLAAAGDHDIDEVILVIFYKTKVASPK